MIIFLWSREIPFLIAGDIAMTGINLRGTPCIHAGKYNRRGRVRTAFSNFRKYTRTFKVGVHGLLDTITNITHRTFIKYVYNIYDMFPRDGRGEYILQKKKKKKKISGKTCFAECRYYNGSLCSVQKMSSSSSSWPTMHVISKPVCTYICTSAIIIIIVPKDLHYRPPVFFFSFLADPWPWIFSAVSLTDEKKLS